MITRSRVRFSPGAGCCVLEQGTYSHHSQQLFKRDVKPQISTFFTYKHFRSFMNESCMQGKLKLWGGGGQVAFVFRLPAGQVEFSGSFLTLSFSD